MRKIIFIALLLLIVLKGNSKTDDNLQRAEKTLEIVLKLNNAGHDHLLLETFPYKENEKVTYLAGEDTISGRRVAYLWPTSGLFSGVNALLRMTKSKTYSKLLDEKILPGLANYYDADRKPACYQSYIKVAGESDRFYDDNIWLALDYLESYQLTNKQEYLNKSKELWQFILSGSDENLGGGIYWCEQKRKSKNTCSNAPAAVLALKLYLATNESDYLEWGKKIYDWTKENLQDASDHLYFDNINLEGKVDQRKYAYNSGQMLQAAALLYQVTREEEYLLEARNIAKSAIKYFTEEFVVDESRTIRLFKNTGSWFNAVLFRGYLELYYADKNPEYMLIFQENMDYLWNSVRDENGLFSKDWSGEKSDKYKWLLDQVSLIEIWANLSGMKLQDK
ncbi:glycoside hydrolase family 76 protein [Maribellus sediminis]|uniref:glycoside hydrolase family 76 protein n=1 Tax=Maribellus sediminis TaxID=2696285 RepID=UPI00142F9165|nr:glycoside hydrolase family 76 protein [Maribellus sediminis]